MAGNLRIGVVGAGKFGGYHAGKCMAHVDIDFVGVFDHNNDAAVTLVERTGGVTFSSLPQLFDACEAVIIAAPATSHGEIAIQALKRGLHILVEKPLATDLSSAEEIASLSASRNLIVQIGHQERFVARAIGLTNIPEKPILIKAQRLNPFSPRGTDTSVTMDLMTHDIDLANYLMATLPLNVRAHTEKRLTDRADHSLAYLQYEDGEVFLEASRLAESSHRSLEISYPSGTVIIDLNAKTLRHDTPFELDDNFGEAPDAKDSLGAGTNEFVSAIKENRSPFISVRDGLEAVRIALKIDGEI